MITKRDKLYSDLFLFLIITAVLIIIGTLFVYSSSFMYALELHNDPHYFLKRHLIGIFLGISVAFFIRFIPLHIIYDSSFLIMIGTLIITTGTLFSPFARQIHGAKRWISLGITFQPSELLKMTFIIWLATILSQPIKKVFSLKTVATIIVIIGLISYILLLQPDFGMTVTLWTVSTILFFIAHGYALPIVSGIIACIPLLIFIIIRQPYRLQRILTFLNPWNDPHGKGFQIIQSLIALGSGGIFGTGIAHSKQKLFYLPMQHTDFIFSIIAEETGFIGALLICFLFILFMYFGFRIAYTLADSKNSLVVSGCTMIISVQAITNIAVCIGLVPTKGVGLPFMSYGNTALVCNIIMIGLIAHIVYEQRGIF